MLRHPSGVAVDGSGNVYIADSGNGRIRKVDTTGTITTFASVTNPRGLVAAPAGDLYVADVFACGILKIAPACQVQTIASLSPFCGEPTRDLAMNGESDIFVTYSSRVLRISAGGQVTTLAGTQDGTANDDGGPATQARLMGAAGVAVDPAGNVYLSEPSGHSVRKVAADGRITTVAGNRLPGFSGDGGLAPAAQLSTPTGLSMDAASSLYIADTYNHRIRKVTTPAAPSPGLMIATNAFAGVTVLVDGAPVTERRVWTWPVGSQHLLDVPTPQLMDGGATRYRFSHWSQGGPKAQTIAMPENQVTYTAHFHADFRFRVTTVGSGTVSLNPPLPADGFYPSGTVVTMTATPAPGWLFPGFLDPNQGKLVNPWTFTVWGPRELNVAFIADGSAASGPLRFVAVTPCRVMDTRPGEGKTGPFGAPALEGGQTRTVPIPESTCGIPATAAAYSLNATVVPSGALGFLTLWPAGQNQPQVSTLNSFEGRVVANAAIVPAGPGGAVNVFVTDETHVILDINGYFVPE
jgi:sugar lactone lactonase YvrE